ncbi:MAG: hypothetical protein AB7O24_09865 [Kofleriaceae bacterium]
MTELAKIERQLAIIERVEKPVSFTVGAIAAAAYFYIQYIGGWIATYSWLIPFAIVGGVTLFAFSWWASKLETSRLAIVSPRSIAEMPQARLLSPSESRSVSRSALDPDNEHD